MVDILSSYAPLAAPPVEPPENKPPASAAKMTPLEEARRMAPRIIDFLEQLKAREGSQFDFEISRNGDFSGSRMGINLRKKGWQHHWTRPLTTYALGINEIFIDAVHPDGRVDFFHTRKSHHVSLKRILDDAFKYGLVSPDIYVSACIPVPVPILQRIDRFFGASGKRIKQAVAPGLS